MYVNYHIDGDLLFYSHINGESFGLNGEFKTGIILLNELIIQLMRKVFQ